MSATKVFPAVKDTVRAKESDHPRAKDGGGERHLLAGAQGGFIYTSYVKFDPNWANVAKIVRANLVLTTERDVHPGWPNNSSGIKVFRLKSEFPDPNNGESEGEFVGRYDVEPKDGTHAANGTIASGDGAINRVNVTNLVCDFAPRSVKRPNGNPGGNQDHHGFAIERRTTNSQSNPRMCVGSSKNADVSLRPYIELVYEPKKSSNSVTPLGPTGNVSDIADTSFTGTFNIGANQPNDVRPARWYIELFKAGGSKAVWTYDGAASPSDVLDLTYTVPLSLVAGTGSRYRFESGTGYEYRVRAKDNKGSVTDWSAKRAFGILTNPPTLSNLRPSVDPALETLNNVYFQAGYFDPDGNPLDRFQVQLRTQTSTTDPAWEEDLLWDSGPVSGSGYSTQTPGQPTEIKFPYGGVGLDPGTYSWRIKAWDVLGAESVWYYADVDLTKGWEAEPGEVDLLTGYAHRRLKARVLIKGLKNDVQYLVVVGQPDNGTFRLTYDYATTTAIQEDASAADVESALKALSNIGSSEVNVTKSGSKYTVTFTNNGTNRPKLKAGSYNNFAADERVDVYSDRAPGVPIAVIEDASNIGASEMYNDGGEFFFSLPAVHPQVAVIEPYQVHYALEVFRGESWKEIAAGYITDFDATDSDVVFYGQDYMAILARQVDERFNARTAADAEAKLWPDSGGGSKYVHRTIKEIIQDQLDRSIHDTGSPLAFFTRAGLPPMTDDISIFVAFKQRLPFIAGLIDSHRQGTGKRTRLYAKKTGPGAYQWVIKDAPGKDRPNIRMEYGGLVQGFRVVPFGDFATRLNAIGRLYNKSTLEYKIAKAPRPSGEDEQYYEETYGRFAKAVTYEDISDPADLNRRAKQQVKRITRVGKALALNLRPGSFAIKDGWDITDNILVDIDRGVVSTTRMGSGYWTIWGWTWELKPNGQEMVTLSILPREDNAAPDADLIPPSDINSGGLEWQIEARDPDDVLDIDVFTHVNSTTGHIFQRDASTGLWVDRTIDLPLAPVILNDGAVDATRMAPTYKGVLVGEELPPLPDPLFPAGALATDPDTGQLMQASLTDEWEVFEGVPGPPGPPGPAGGAVLSSWWDYDSAEGAPPLTGTLRTLGSGLGSDTVFWLHNTDAGGLDWSGMPFAVGDTVILRNTTGETGNFRVTSVEETGSGATGYKTLHADYVSGAGTLKKNEQVNVSLVQKASAGDGLPPPVVTGLAVTPQYVEQSDGTSIPIMSLAWDLLPQSDILGYEVEWDTGTYDYPPDSAPVYVPADWVGARQMRASKDRGAAWLIPVLGSRTYDVRVRAYDTEGFVGPWVEVSETAALPDTVAPSTPSVGAVGGYKLLGATWDANDEADFSHYEVQFRRVEDPPLEWTPMETRSTRIVISDLEPGTYEIQVRSLDHSRNASAWSPIATGEVTLIGQSDVVFDSVLANIVSAGSISADDIKTGTLNIGGTGEDNPSIRVFNAAGDEIGAWGEFGWIVADPYAPKNAIWAGRSAADPTGELGVFFSNDYQWDPATQDIEAGIPISVWQAAITPRGVNAEAILFGAVGGGSNRILNAGIELQAYPIAASAASKKWDVTADWDDVLASGRINLDVSGGDLKMSAT